MTLGAEALVLGCGHYNYGHIVKIHYFSENRLWLPQMVRASISHVESFA